jgi:hypothetical protein
MAKGKHGHFQYYEIPWPNIIIIAAVTIGILKIAVLKDY